MQLIVTNSQHETVRRSVQQHKIATIDLPKISYFAASKNEGSAIKPTSLLYFSHLTARIGTDITQTNDRRHLQSS